MRKSGDLFGVYKRMGFQQFVWASESQPLVMFVYSLWLLVPVVFSATVVAIYKLFGRTKERLPPGE